MSEKKQLKIVTFFKTIMNRLDKKLQDKAKGNCCSKKEKGSSCCS